MVSQARLFHPLLYVRGIAMSRLDETPGAFSNLSIGVPREGPRSGDA